MNVSVFQWHRRRRLASAHTSFPSAPRSPLRVITLRHAFVVLSSCFRRAFARSGRLLQRRQQRPGADTLLEIAKKNARFYVVIHASLRGAVLLINLLPKGGEDSIFLTRATAEKSRSRNNHPAEEARGI